MRGRFRAAALRVTIAIGTHGARHRGLGLGHGDIIDLGSSHPRTRIYGGLAFELHSGLRVVRHVCGVTMVAARDITGRVQYVLSQHALTFTTVCLNIRDGKVEKDLEIETSSRDSSCNKIIRSCKSRSSYN